MTELVFILDRSGSMSGLEADTIGGFNSMIEKQKKEAGEAVVSTVLFANGSSVIHDRLLLGEVPPLTEKEYFTCGCTALLDAVGGAIHHIGNIHKYARREGVPEKTMFIITTDGYENASRRYDYERVRRMIERQKEKYGWEFLFLGANIDAAKEAARFGIGADRSVNYKCDEEGTALNYEVIAPPWAASAPQGLSAPTGSAASTRMCRSVGDDKMYGAILGDIVGSPYEFDCNNYKAKEFPLFSQRSEFTDDTVMTLAVAKALLSSRGQDDDAIKAALVREMQQLGRAYPDRGYGTHFGGWLYEDDPQPYQSYGNGSAMRVSSAAWLAKDMAESLRLAHLTAQVSHNHPEGIKGAQATAAAVFLARTGHGKEKIKAYVEREFGYDLSRTCDEIRPTYHHVESCQETVPQAITAFLESRDFEDALRTAVSLGGDSDTLAAITGSIAETFYGVPEELRQEGRKRLTPELAEILRRWESALYNEKICGKI